MSKTFAITFWRRLSSGEYQKIRYIETKDSNEGSMYVENLRPLPHLEHYDVVENVPVFVRTKFYYNPANQDVISVAVPAIPYNG